MLNGVISTVYTLQIPTLVSPTRLTYSDVYADVLLQGRRNGPPGTPTAFETSFGWVLTGKTDSLKFPSDIAAHHATILVGDDILRKFWEIEECPRNTSNHSPEERVVVRHFADPHKRNKDGGFVGTTT